MIRHRLWRLALLFWLASLVACQAQPVNLQANEDAVLKESTETVRDELRGTLASMLNVPSVTVADDALTHDSLLIIEKVRPRDANGIQLSGRDFDRPEQFRIVKNLTDCILIRVRTGTRKILREVHCITIKK